MIRQNYLDFLQYGFPEQLEDVPLVIRLVMYYQHDGVPRPYTRRVMQHLSDMP